MLKRGTRAAGRLPVPALLRHPALRGRPPSLPPPVAEPRGPFTPLAPKATHPPPQLQPHPPSTPKHHPPSTAFTNLGPRERNPVTVAEMRREAPAHPPTQQRFAPSFLEKPQLSQGLGLPDIMVSLKLFLSTVQIITQSDDDPFPPSIHGIVPSTKYCSPRVRFSESWPKRDTSASLWFFSY